MLCMSYKLILLRIHVSLREKNIMITNNTSSSTIAITITMYYYYYYYYTSNT